jgi:hypothetical protein
MPARRNLRTAVLTLICVVGLFLFPAAIGSFAATHGPVTAMRASSQARQVKVAMHRTSANVPTITAYRHPLAATPAAATASDLVLKGIVPFSDISSSLRI